MAKKKEPASGRPKQGHEGGAHEPKPPSHAQGGEGDEAAYYRETLKANHRIAGRGKPLGPGQTHRFEEDAKGRAVLRRKRFSAI